MRMKQNVMLSRVYGGVPIRCTFKLLAFNLWIELMSEDDFSFCENDKACQWNGWYFKLNSAELMLTI